MIPPRLQKKLIPEINKKDLDLSKVFVYILEGDFAKQNKIKNKYYMESLKEIDKNLKIKINKLIF